MRVLGVPGRRMSSAVGTAASVAAAMLLVIPSLGARASSPPPVPSIDAGSAAVIARYQARIPELMAEQGVPGIAIAVVDGDHVLWAQGFGSSARHDGTPVTTDTIFSVQSMSKLFTATAVMQAVGEGRLDLDMPITAYLPSFTVHSAFEANPEQKITLRMLLSHTAGFTHEAPVGSNYDGDAADWDAHVRSISDTWLRFPVGTGYAYSNLGIDLAAAIIEQVDGKPFPDVMRDRLLGPLGMDRSTFDKAEIRATGDRAIGLTAMTDQPLVDMPMTGAGGLYASAADLARFLEFQLGDGIVDGRTILAPTLIEEQRTVPAPHEGAGMGYALGVSRTRWRAERYVDLFNHGGGGWGFLSDLWWAPALQLGIAVLTNSSEHDLQGNLALSVMHDLVEEPGSVFHRRLLAQPWQTDVVDLDGRYLPPTDMSSRINRAAMPPTGDEAARWAGYSGLFRVPEWGVINPTTTPDRFLVDRGRPVFETSEGGSPVRHPLVEVAPGVFLADNGETLDLSGPRATWRAVRLVPAAGGPSPLSWGLLAAAAAVAAAWLVGGVIGVVRRRRRGRVDAIRAAGQGWSRLLSILATAAALVVLASVGLMVVVPGLVDSGFIGWVELPPAIVLALHLPLALAALAVALVALGGIGWARAWWSPVRRPRVTAMTVAAVALAAQLAVWNLVGWGLG